MQRWQMHVNQKDDTKNEELYFQVAIKRNWKRVTKIYCTKNLKKKTHPLDA